MVFKYCADGEKRMRVAGGMPQLENNDIVSAQINCLGSFLGQKPYLQLSQKPFYLQTISVQECKHEIIAADHLRKAEATRHRRW